MAAIRRAWLALSLAWLFQAAVPARAAEPNFYGAWLVTQARLAPWAKPDAPASNEETRRLIGSKLVYRKLRIDGLSPLGCDKPRYRVFSAAPDYLFQGGLTRPVAQARALGFRLRRITTLETGCEGDIDFHFTDRTTALFGLNDMIYTLRRL